MQEYFAAIDRVNDYYDVIVVDSAGVIVAEFQFAPQPAGWNEFDQKMHTFRGCPFAIGPSGSAPEQLLKRDYAVYQANSKVAKWFQKEKVPSNFTTERRGLWAL